MDAVTIFHNDAMDWTEMAFLAERKGEDDKATRFFIEALRYEKLAIAELKADPVQPSYSVLHRSAATLALRCGRFAEADELCREGASAEGCPPEIRDEIFEVKRVAEVALNYLGAPKWRNAYSVDDVRTSLSI